MRDASYRTACAAPALWTVSGITRAGCANAPDKMLDGRERAE